MNEISFSQIEDSLKNKQLNFYNFYNNDIKFVTQQTARYYLKHPHDVISNQQILNAIYLDIEVYSDNQIFDDEAIDGGIYPVNIVTIVPSNVYKIHTFLLLFDKNYEAFGIKPNMSDDDFNNLISEKEKYFEDELKKRKYIGNQFISDEYTVELKLYNDEKQLLIDLWNTIHEYDPDILTSWYGDNFDYWYLYNRIVTLFGEDKVGEILSKFGQVSIHNKRVHFFEYTVADLQYLYKPRDEGGLQYGSKQPLYSLNYVSKTELNLEKVKYIGKNVSLNDFFISDPIESTLYNIVDVLLIVGLGNKLQFFDLHNTIRRAMKCPFSSSIIGSSALYDSFVFSELDKDGQRVRDGIIGESAISFDKDYISKFGSIKGTSKSKEVLPCSISGKEFINVTRKFPGAYVKQPYPEIIADNSMIIDLDATSMYPSNILQGNISFDCYIARVIPPQCYSTIKLLNMYLGTREYPIALMSNVQKMVTDYVNDKGITPKSENIQKFYYTTLALFARLMESNKTFNEICHPSCTTDSLLLRNNLIPLLDVIFTIHPTSQVYNDFVYDFVYKTEENQPDKFDNRNILKQIYPDGVWIIFNPNESNTELKQITIDELFDLVKKYSISFSGCMFLKHIDKKGLFVDMLINFANLRKHHKNLRNTFEKGSREYKFEDNNQNVFKRLMNTSYGLYGMSGFRYSNHWLARSITNNSLHALKVAMYLGEDYLTNKYGNIHNE